MLSSPAPVSPTLPPPADSARQIRGFALASRPEAVTTLSPFHFHVHSSDGRHSYQVFLKDDRWVCTCLDFTARSLPCKHLSAVRFRLLGPTSPPPPVSRPTYPQNWPAYNQAQLSELRVFHCLLSDLVAKARDPRPLPETGRPRLRFPDLLFCAIDKVYSQTSLRRAYGHFEQACALRQIRHPPSFVMPSLLFRREDVTPVLTRLIAISAAPLAGLETIFAVDSSGFRTTNFGAYCQETHGASRMNIWKKAHVVVGVATHIIPTVVVTGGNEHDTLQFGPLVQSVSQAGFHI